MTNQIPFKKIIVTGSSGMIGTTLCEEFEKIKLDYIPIDRKNNKWNFKIDAKTQKLDLLNDPMNYDIRSIEPVDLIIHLAANARVYELVEKPHLGMENFQTIFNILEFARMNNIKNVIFASSREVYGNIDNTGSTNETQTHIDNCESIYASSKMAGEAMLRAYAKCYGINFVIVRFSNVYGKYDDSDRFIPTIIRQCIKGEDHVIYGAQKELDFTYIDDAINGIKIILEHFDKMKGETYNIASGKPNTLVATAHMIGQLTTDSTNIIISENRPGEVIKYTADISKISKFGYAPKTNINDGLKKTIEWYLR